MSSENNFSIKITMGVILIYIVASVAAKMSVKLWGSNRKIPENSSKFTKNAMFYIFWFPVHKNFSAV